MPSSGFAFEGSTLAEMTCPTFRSVEYHHTDLSQDRSMMTVTNLLRELWHLQPANAKDLKTEEEAHSTVNSFMFAWHQFSDGEKAAVPLNKDTGDTHTLWRRGVYRQTSPVFVDTFGFLAESGSSARYGHYHCPNNEVVVVADGPEDVRCWEKNHVMLLPVYQAKGITVKIMKVLEDGKTEEKGKFDAENPFVTWFIRAKQKWKLTFEREDGSEPLDGPAAVVVVGVSCEKEVLMPEEVGNHEFVPSVTPSEGSKMVSYGESNREESE